MKLAKGTLQFLMLVLALVGLTMLALADSNQSVTPEMPRVEYAAPKPKSIIKITHLGTTDADIVCLNGADPTGNKYGNVLIVSCTDRRPK